MILKKSLQLCGRVAKNTDDDRLKYIRVKTTGDMLELLATDKFRIVKENLKIDKPIKINGFIKLESIKNIQNTDDIKKYLINAPEFPEMPVFKFNHFVEVESEPLKRFCKMYVNKNITIKITMGQLLISYKDDEVKTKIEIGVIKSNTRYLRTTLNSKLLKDILKDDKLLKIKTGKSGNDPISFNNQIIMPVKIRD